jgi:hypothetical protein
VSEVEDWNLLDLVPHIMDKETVQRLLGMMKSLFARKSEEMKEMITRQEKANAKMKAAFEELTADLKAMVAARMDANEAEMLACPEEMEANVEFRRNGGYEFGSYPGNNRGRSGAEGTLKGRD